MHTCVLSKASACIHAHTHILTKTHACIHVHPCVLAKAYACIHVHTHILSEVHAWFDALQGLPVFQEEFPHRSPPSHLTHTFNLVVPWPLYSFCCCCLLPLSWELSPVLFCIGLPPSCPVFLSFGNKVTPVPCFYLRNLPLCLCALWKINSILSSKSGENGFGISNKSHRNWFRGEDVTKFKTISLGKKFICSF